MPTVLLDPEQQAAVDHRHGPCLVLAGPGSGKTRVIVERFLALVEEGIPAHRQLVLTYTAKAASEMRERAEAVFGPFDGASPLTTFHAFARRVVREWGWLVGIPPTFRVGDPAERWLHLDAVLDDLRLATLWNPLRPHDLVGPLLDLFEKAKQQLVRPADYAAWADSRLAVVDDPTERALLVRHRECATAYAAYQERLRRHAVLDHDDCILVAWHLLAEHEAAQRAVCGPLIQVMVDEFQDTNDAQARLLDVLVGAHGNVMVVADDDQSIYKFRGASRANIERFRRTYPDCRIITLRRNYRSTAPIVVACRALIDAAPAATRIAKDIVAVRDVGEPVEVWCAPDERSEVAAVARECRRLVDAGIHPRNIAWLFRRHADMPPAMLALQACGVPYQVHGGRGFFRQPEIKDVLALLAVVVDPDDSQALIRCLRLPAWSVSNAGRLAIVRACRDDDTPLVDRLLTESIAGVDEADAKAARDLARTVVDLHAASLDGDCRDILFDALERSRFLDGVADRPEIERIQVGANLNKLAELLDAFADWSDDLRLAAALRYLEVLRDRGAADEVAPIELAVDGVALMTAHSAKGLEWPIVVVSGCVDSRWPGSGGSGGLLQLPDDLVGDRPPPGETFVDEERRLLYVAATRAADRLILTWAKRYPRAAFTDQRRSRFLDVLETTPEVVRRGVPFAPAASPARRTVAPETRLPRLRVSVHDLRDFAACPRRFEYARRYQLPPRPSVQRWYGTLVHSVLERAGRLRLQGEAVDAARLLALWEEAWAASGKGYRGTHPELREHGRETLSRYGTSPAWQEAHIVAVEDPFALTIADREVHGRFDRIDDRLDDVPVVVDYKTGPPSTSDGLARDIQVRAYAVAMARRRTTDHVAVELHYLQTAEVRRVDVEGGDLQRAENHLSAVTAEVGDAWRERSFPARPSTWRCRRCDYRTVCDERSD